MVSRSRVGLFGAFLLAIVAGVLAGTAFPPVLAGSAEPDGAKEIEEETPDQPPGKPASENLLARTPGLRVAFGSYLSIQVNVDLSGNNILGDAANEPTLAVNPQNPMNMVAGWRQFDTIASNFRQAGWAYTFDGGQTWTFPGVLEPGVFRSDPVIGADSHGIFYYQSLKGNLRADVFRSINGGVSWSVAVPEFGGDKNWLAIDRNVGPSEGFLYGVWQRFGGACCGTNVFTRSTNGAASFQTPVPVSFSPTFGTLTVGPSSEVYATGVDGTVTQDFAHFVVAKSTNAGNPAVTPTFTGRRVEIGGSMGLGGGPNPGGLLGQANVVVNGAPGVHHGEVYLLASVIPPAFDPLEVNIVRSADGGATWSLPTRVNDDPFDDYQWMAATAVAPNGRIDAIWNDTRFASAVNVSQLYYAYSWDGGATWSKNEPVTPPFDSSLGYPQQNKMGDYSTIVSDATGADAVYTATFNGEEDVYYVRVFPDCNSNGVSDVTDLAAGDSFDCDTNHVPDECQTELTCIGAGSAPDGQTGTKLAVVKAGGGALLLTWGASCQSDDDDFAVYEGALGAFASHAPRLCSTDGSTMALVSPSSGSRYYLVVPTHADREGSYGKTSAGAERPAGTGACFPQALRPCI